MRLAGALASAFVALAIAGACSSESSPGSGGAAPASGSGTGGAIASSGSSAIVTGPTGTGGALPHSFTVSGVVTDGTNPVGGAIVMQAGGAPVLTTGPDGAYTITLTQDIPGTPTVVAAKLGYRTAGVEFLSLPDGPVELALRFAAPPDNTGYVFGDPGTGDAAHDDNTSYCGHCHATLVKQFQTSAHAKSARDPLVQDLYAGVTEAHADQASCEAAGGAWKTGLVPGNPTSPEAKCYLGGGVLPDLNATCGGASQPACDDPSLPAAEKPTLFGACADCHAPGIDGKAGGRNLHEATGVSFANGNHCDVCHHVRDVDLTKPAGVAGRLVLQRPNEKVSDMIGAKLLQVMYGPFPDVPNQFMGGSYQPKFLAADLCAGCHELNQQALVPGTTLDASKWPNGLPTHSTFEEWSNSPFAKANKPCQTCHMPPDDTGLKSSIDVTDATNASITYGFLRPPDQLRKHVFLDPLSGSPRLIDGAVALVVSGATSGSELTVTVKLANQQAGHAFPTGEPMRAGILVVSAVACGAPLAASGGMTIFDAGGATAEGTVGVDASFAGATLTWSEGAARAKAGDVVRVVRPTGTYDDYPGIGYFANTALSPTEKGLEIREPVGEAIVASASGGAVTLASAIAAQPGDIVFLGDALSGPPSDASPSRALAGASGYAFARVLVDATGARNVPHYRAVDIASDNRLAAGVETTTSHRFAIATGCSGATVTATLVYRPIPVGLGRARGWDARDYVATTTTATVPLP